VLPSTHERNAIGSVAKRALTIVVLQGTLIVAAIVTFATNLAPAGYRVSAHAIFGAAQHWLKTFSIMNSAFDFAGRRFVNGYNISG
jgi:F0F1-type ATP synthase assembly protein I